MANEQSQSRSEHEALVRELQNYAAERVLVNTPYSRAAAELIQRAAAVLSKRGLSRDLVLSAIDSEPEVPGHMPDAMWEAIRNDRDACEEAFRIGVRQTKDGIRERFLAKSNERKR